MTGAEIAGVVLGALGTAGSSVSLVWQSHTRHDAVTPDLEVLYEWDLGEDWLHVQNKGPVELSWVEVHISKIGTGEWPVFFTGSHPTWTTISEPLRVGTTKMLALNRNDPAAGVMQVRLECHRRWARPWVISRDVDVFEDPAHGYGTPK